jgi:hypothetical protein
MTINKIGIVTLCIYVKDNNSDNDLISRNKQRFIEIAYIKKDLYNLTNILCNCVAISKTIQNFLSLSLYFLF